MNSENNSVSHCRESEQIFDHTYSVRLYVGTECIQYLVILFVLGDQQSEWMKIGQQHTHLSPELPSCPAGKMKAVKIQHVTNRVNVTNTMTTYCCVKLTRQSLLWAGDPAQWGFQQTERQPGCSLWFSFHTPLRRREGQRALYPRGILLSCR